MVKQMSRFILPSDIQKGDLITYRCGRKNFVNKPFKYELYFNANLENENYGSSMDIMIIQRYVKGIFGYKFKTIYFRREN